MQTTRLENMTTRHWRQVGVVAGFLGLCGLLLTLRVGYSRSLTYAFLVWNLFLATIPFVISVAIECRPEPRRLWLLPLWLLFFPNAPYIMTDLLHLAPKQDVPLWFDLLLLLSAAGAGAYLGCVSLQHVHGLITRRCGMAAGWTMAVGILFLSAFGIYLGRFGRWNSWDVLVSPLELGVAILHRFAAPWEHPRTWAVTIGLGLLMTLGYIAVTDAAAKERAE